MEYEDKGFAVHHCPMEEDSIPSLVHCARLVGNLQKTLLAGKKAVIQSEVLERVLMLCYILPAFIFLVGLQLHRWIWKDLSRQVEHSLLVVNNLCPKMNINIM